MASKRENSIVSAELEQVETPKNSSFTVGKYEHYYFTRPWHYHPEFELLLITKGFGTRMVGDHFEQFEAGDLVLLAGNLPHAWISDPYFLESTNTDTCESLYVQFQKSLFGTQFIDIPELESIRTILREAERGIKLKGKSRKDISEQMLALNDTSALKQLLVLIDMLDQINQADYELLASTKYIKQQSSFKSPKMRELHNYMMQHFKKELTLEQCATHIEMTPTSFCRFIKTHTKDTFSAYLNKMRISFAKRLLAYTTMPIKEVGFSCGFSSIVYFNQVFKRLVGVSPKAYRFGERKQLLDA